MADFISAMQTAVFTQKPFVKDFPCVFVCLCTSRPDELAILGLIITYRGDSPHSSVGLACQHRHGVISTRLKNPMRHGGVKVQC